MFANSKHNSDLIRLNVFLLATISFHFCVVFFGFIDEIKFKDLKCLDVETKQACSNEAAKQNDTGYYVNQQIKQRSANNDGDSATRRYKRAAIKPPPDDKPPAIVNDTKPGDWIRRYKLYGWPMDEQMLKRLEVFITRKFEDFMSRYYDPKGFHGQETHPIYGKFGTRFITREPLIRTHPYNKLITKIWTRPPNHTWAFSTKYFATNQTLPPPDTNTRPTLYGWPVDEQMFRRLEVFITRKFEDFMSRYYDPKGFHGQETHPIYGKFGTRFITREPFTRTDPYNILITKVWTRPPNHTWPFTQKTFTTPEFGYYDESEVDDRILREYEEDKKKKFQIKSQPTGTKN